MLNLDVSEKELFNELTGEFFTIPAKTIKLEHSLVSISKWESKWKKPFLSSEKSAEEIIDYIKLMTISQNVEDEIYNYLNNEEINKVTEYISDTMTATWFNEKQEKKSPTSREIITSEIIYYWMIQLNIPVEFQKWHINRLLTLIKVCSIKNEPPKKMSKRELLNRNSKLNAERRKMLNSKG